MMDSMLGNHICFIVLYAIGFFFSWILFIRMFSEDLLNITYKDFLDGEDIVMILLTSAAFALFWPISILFLTAYFYHKIASILIVPVKFIFSIAFVGKKMPKIKLKQNRGKE